MKKKKRISFHAYWRNDWGFGLERKKGGTDVDDAPPVLYTHFSVPFVILKFLLMLKVQQYR